MKSIRSSGQSNLPYCCSIILAIAFSGLVGSMLSCSKPPAQPKPAAVEAIRHQGRSARWWAFDLHDQRGGVPDSALWLSARRLC